MEEVSKFSGAITNGLGEVSDSNSTILQFFPTNHIHEEGSVSASKFKGVVSQQNGNWGAQIYANHQRIWLGTFRSETEAARAYDSAAIKLRNGDTHRNFPWTGITVQEPKFQSQLRTDVVLAMIKDGSYEAQFSDYLKAQVQESYRSVIMEGLGNGKLTQLFQKELTPSDVSKLNRLVIPKKYAVKYFRAISDSNENGGDGLDDVELEFFDRDDMEKSWKFRYCYWKSSQSFVFTRGWNRFVKTKELKAKDKVIFSSYEKGDYWNGEQRTCIIDVVRSDGRIVGPVVGGYVDDGAREIMVEHYRFEERESGIEKMDFAYEFEKVGKGSSENQKGNMGNVSGEVEKKGFRLFGVQIS